jgi:hypothetical protein
VNLQSGGLLQGFKVPVTLAVVTISLEALTFEFKLVEARAKPVANLDRVRTGHGI